MHSATRSHRSPRRLVTAERSWLGHSENLFAQATALPGLAARMSRSAGVWRAAWRPAIAPISPPAPDSFAPELVAKGEALAGGGYCAECHTAKGGQKFAGGYPMATPFGVIYSTNITPDPETGIGTWSEAAFARAMHEGVARDGSHLLPGFPYDHFTKLSDDDVKALYAYFMTRLRSSLGTANYNSVSVQHPRLAGGWKLLFFRPDASKRMPQERRMEPWRLSRAGAEPLRRLPHAAQPARRGKDGRSLCRRGDRQLDRSATDSR